MDVGLHDREVHSVNRWTKGTLFTRGILYFKSEKNSPPSQPASADGGVCTFQLLFFNGYVGYLHQFTFFFSSFFRISCKRRVCHCGG